MIKRFTKQLIFKAIETTKADQENYIIRGVFSTSDVDRQGEIIDQNGWKLDEYMQNPVVLFAHDHWQPAIGKMVELGKNAVGSLVGAIQFAAKEYDFAKTIYNLYLGGYMKAFSVGFETPMEKVEQVGETIVLREANLYEVSAVNVPANAMALAYSKGIDMNPLIKRIRDGKNIRKGVMPFVASPMRPEGTSWDANAVQSAVWQDGENQARYAKIHAWFDDNQNDDDGDGYPDIKSAYKLPHHDENLKVVWDGVASAMAALLGARGGVNIPDADRQGVYNHLAKHYAQFGKEVPEFKTYQKEEKSPTCRADGETKEECISRKVPEIMADDPNMDNTQAVAIAENMCGTACSAKALEVISASNKETILSAIKTLTDVLKAAGIDKKVDKVETPEKGDKKISVKLLNKAIRELLELKKLKI